MTTLEQVSSFIYMLTSAISDTLNAVERGDYSPGPVVQSPPASRGYRLNVSGGLQVSPYRAGSRGWRMGGTSRLTRWFGGG